MKASLFICALFACATSAVADDVHVSSKARASLMSNQIELLDKRLERENAPTIAYFSDPPVIADTGAGQVPSPYLETARSMARQHDLPEALFLRLIARESGWNPRAVSPKGAIGLAQLMPDTARLLRVDPHDPIANLEGGARYLRQMHDKFGRWDYALAAYNAGPDAVLRYRGIPPYRETQDYVAAILRGL